MPSAVTKLIFRIPNSGTTTNTSKRHDDQDGQAEHGEPVRVEPGREPRAPAAEPGHSSASCSRWIAAGNANRERGAGHEVGPPAAQLEQQPLVVDVQRDAREAAEEDAFLDAPDQRVGVGRGRVDQLDMLGTNADVGIAIRAPNRSGKLAATPDSSCDR